MTESVEPDLEKRIARLERRLAREKSSRAKAEEIADRGMRDLWLANRELDERVAERTSDLETTLQELEIASTSRERFLSVLSHEMRTPLNGVLGMLELLEPHTSGDQGATYLQAAQESATGLDNLIRRLLDLVELNTGSMTASRAPVSAKALVAEMQSRWQTEALRTGHLLVFVSHLGDQGLVVDSARINQIIDELLDNAVAHASPGVVDVRVLQAGSSVAIEVEDSGPGIPAEQLEQLLGNHVADMSTNRASQGLGLGLGLSRRIAEALGGSLHLQPGERPSGPSTIARLVMPADLDVDIETAA